MMDAEGRAWLSAITSSTNDAVIAEDAEGRVIAWNRAAERILGYPLEEVVGVPTSHLMVDLEGAGCAEVFSLVRTGARVQGVRATCRTQSGKGARLVLDGAPIWDADGSFKGVALVGRDVSEGEALTQQANEAVMQRRQALELNDSVVQGLTVALMSLALDDKERCLKTLQTTLGAAKHIISEMLGNSEEEVDLEDMELRRSGPAALERPAR